MIIKDSVENEHTPKYMEGWRVWISIFLAVNLVHLPNLIACFIPAFSWIAVSHWIFGCALTLLACALGLRVRSMLWLAFPVILLVPSCLACLFAIHNLPSTFLLLALFEANPAEMAALQVYVNYAVAGTLLLAALYVWFVRTRVAADFRLGLLGRVLILLTLLLPPGYDMLKMGPVASLARIQERCLSTFPFSTLYGVYEAYDMRARVTNRKDVLEQLEVRQEPEFRDEAQRQVHMLVIGESATKSCFGMYGYERLTTPMLEHTPGVLPFRDVSSTATFTLLAVPALLTAAPPGKVLEATRQASILSAYKKAGFRVYWLSAQKKHGTFDTLTSIFSADADEAVFQGGTFDTQGVGGYGGTRDTPLLPLVRSILQRHEQKVLFVLHTIGSHAPYEERYSPQLARFPADSQAVMGAVQRIHGGTSLNPQDLELVQNAYDNTICATDFLLANLINELKQSEASTWLCYVSDHGENTSTAMLGKFMHGTITRQVVEIPMLMWLSPQYEQAHPARAAALKANLNTPFSAACTFHTLLDMGGLSCPDFKPGWSSASPAFSPGARMVCNPNGGLVDYDQKFPVRQAAMQTRPEQPVSNEHRLATGVGQP